MSFKLTGTSTFLSDIKHLTKKPKKGYSSLPHDICEFLSTLTSDEVIRMVPETIFMKDTALVKKCRIKNSGLNLSDKNGFRLIFLFKKENQQIVFLTVFPKRGSDSKENISIGELQILLAEYIAEKEALSDFQCDSHLIQIERSTEL